ncbi:RNA polymerase sigma factor [Sorangium sp. So ce861]|uniref:RNA polymerase sigma factor n=1 Tax=Sorangium sp. So ce861 TaxID=3133323 RepID=UPI003F641024
MTEPQPPRPPLAPAHDADPGPAPEPPPRPSFEEVYTGLLRYVLRVLWRMGVPARHLRDVAQEVFLVVHRRFGDYDPRFSMKAWVASIASHLALRHQRLSRNRRELLARSRAFPPGAGAAEAVSSWEARRAPASLARPGIEVTRAKLAAAGAALFLSGAGTGAGALHAALPRPAPPEIALVRGDALAARPVSSGAPATLADVPAAFSSAAPAPPAATGAKAAVPPMDTDLTLIQRAIAALGTGRATEALEALDRHARSYPRSPRAQQRETLAIQALDQTGRRAEATARAARFRAAFPGSAYLPAIEEALNGAP